MLWRCDINLILANNLLAHIRAMLKVQYSWGSSAKFSSPTRYKILTETLFNIKKNLSKFYVVRETHSLVKSHLKPGCQITFII